MDDSNELHGFDIDEFCVDEAKKLNPSANILQASMEKLPYEDDSFDVIIMSNVFPYYEIIVEKDKKETFISNTFNEVRRVLKKDGILYLTTPNGNSVHYKNRKATLNDIQESMKGFILDVKGWNNLKPLLPAFVNKRYRFIPAKILCKWNPIWEKLVNNMNDDLEVSKYFYITAKKR